MTAHDELSRARKIVSSGGASERDLAVARTLAQIAQAEALVRISTALDDWRTEARYYFAEHEAELDGLFPAPRPHAEVRSPLLMDVVEGTDEGRAP